VRRHEVRAAALGVLAEARRGHAGLFWFAVALAGLAVVALCGVVVDDRMLVGAAIWLKPLKFALSFGLYAFTSAWLLSLVRYRSRIGAVLGAALGWAVVATSAIEIGIIVLQVVRGKRSHFNTETAFDEQLFSIMGTTVAVIWLAALPPHAVAPDVPTVVAGHVYGYRLEPVAGGARVTSYHDWSDIHPEWRAKNIFPIISEDALRATLGILARTVTPKRSA
jgi:hypothetical protein